MNLVVVAPLVSSVASLLLQIAYQDKMRLLRLYLVSTTASFLVVATLSSELI